MSSMLACDLPRVSLPVQREYVNTQLSLCRVLLQILECHVQEEKADHDHEKNKDHVQKDCSLFYVRSHSLSVLWGQLWVWSIQLEIRFVRFTLWQLWPDSSYITSCVILLLMTDLIVVAQIHEYIALVKLIHLLQNCKILLRSLTSKNITWHAKNPYSWMY